MSLRRINLNFNGFTKFVLNDLANLTMIHLQSNNLTEIQLSGAPKLWFLDLNRNKFTNFTDVPFLKSDSPIPLMSLSLSENLIGGELPDYEINPTINFLDLSRNLICGNRTTINFFSPFRWKFNIGEGGDVWDCPSAYSPGTSAPPLPCSFHPLQGVNFSSAPLSLSFL